MKRKIRKEGTRPTPCPWTADPSKTVVNGAPFTPWQETLKALLDCRVAFDASNASMFMDEASSMT
ncbi:MAG: hypothetical protein ACOY58_06955 [Candidatus Micrarchaeota archaeon]